MTRLPPLAARGRSIRPQLQSLIISTRAGSQRKASSTTSLPPSTALNGKTNETKHQSENELVTKKKTLAQLDEELRLKMEGISGEGGASGVEYEDGKAEGLKRGVKSNMFRVI